MHVPLHRYFGLTLERTFTTTTIMRSASSAVMVDVHANQFMFLQRYEWGGSRQLQPGMPAGIERDALQSMASYTMGPRLNVGMRVATQWSPTAPPQSWLEAQATVRVTRRTILQLAAPMPQPLDADRARVSLEQGLPRHFSLLAEYGRPAAYQDIQDATEQPRFKLLLRRGLGHGHAGERRIGQRARRRLHRQAGARCASPSRSVLGGFGCARRVCSSRTCRAAISSFRWIPICSRLTTPGTDGRRRLAVRPSSRIVNDLVVAPLNAIHGRVYVDRDGNGRFDPGEGVAGAVLILGDRVTATGTDGAYDFYNVLPGRMSSGWTSRASRRRSNSRANRPTRRRSA